MTVMKVLELYDNWNTNVVVNDANLMQIATGSGWDIYHNPKINNFPVASFGFYDNEFCIRLNVLVEDNEI